MMQAISLASVLLSWRDVFCLILHCL